MAALTTVNPQILDAVTKTNSAVVGSGVPRAEGAGIAFQAVSQATAMAIQDAVEYMRNVNAVGATTIGIALEIMLADESKIPAMTSVIAAAQGAVSGATTNFTQVGSAAAGIMASYPSS